MEKFYKVKKIYIIVCFKYMKLFVRNLEKWRKKNFFYFCIFTIVYGIYFKINIYLLKKLGFFKK